MKSKSQIIILLSTLALISGCKKDDGNPAAPAAEGLAEPAFRYVSANWFNQVFTLPMDNIWQYYGIAAKGQNYYFLSNPTQARTYSDRFNPQSNYFQSWFGAYTIEDANNTTYALSNNSINAQAILQLSIADQKAWLISFAGMSNPSVSIDTSVAVNVSQVQVDGRSGWKITGSLISNVDVGANNPQSNRPPLLLIPPSAWQGIVGSYAMVKLEVVSYVWYTPENKELNVVYYNGVEFDDLSAAHHRTLPLISAELDSMALHVTVRK
ncbi:MAG: hypothetical protein EHM64_16410 [Ignavibacteriae bacterium]|nr:MAG: hypothetical protein EHM64_16410 [Ignavibacteriota bacterium]